MRFRLQRVQSMPKDLEPGVLYAAEHYGAAAHLCACGCGSKIRTPLGPTEWTLTETPTGPSLRPSVGNWQKPCKSHYVIQAGGVLWAGQWTDAQVAAGRRHEEQRREEYFATRARQRGGFMGTVWRWIKSVFN
jgi:hypothetical protein